MAGPPANDPHLPAPTRVPRWNDVRLVMGGILQGAIAFWSYRTAGLDSSTLMFFLFTSFPLVEGVRSLRGRAVGGAAAVPSRANQGRTVLLIFGSGVVIALASVALERVTIRGTPLLAGPVLRSVHASASPVAANDVARPGHRFVVLDVEVGSHLGAPLRYVYFGDFALEVDGRMLETATGPSLYLPDSCRGLEVPRWETRSCRVTFEVPEAATTARLRIEEGGAHAWSSLLDLRALPQAEVPRVELVARVGVPLPLRHRPGEERIEVLVQVTPLAGAAPVELRRLRLTGPDGAWDALDRSDRTDLARPCEGRVFTSRTFCVAVFDVPRDAATARLIGWTGNRPLSGGEVAAGVATLHF